MKKRFLACLLAAVLLFSLSACTGDEPEPDGSEIVYVTESGTKYHRSGCQHLKKSAIEIPLSRAEANGYTPCSKCW